MLRQIIACSHAGIRATTTELLVCSLRTMRVAERHTIRALPESYDDAAPSIRRADRCGSGRPLGKNVQMIMPDILIVAGFVVLPGGHAVAAVRFFQRQRDHSGCVMDRRRVRFGEIVDVLEVRIGEDQDVAGICPAGARHHVAAINAVTSAS